MWVYFIRCRNGALYCGWTNNLESRLALHRNGRGSRAVRMAGFGGLAACWPVASRSDALRLEARLKRLDKATKEQLVRNPRQIAPIVEALGLENLPAPDHLQLHMDNCSCSIYNMDS